MIGTRWKRMLNQPLPYSIKKKLLERNDTRATKSSGKEMISEPHIVFKKTGMVLWDTKHRSQVFSPLYCSNKSAKIR